MGLTLEEAQEIISAMLKYADEKPGRPMSFAVVDEGGALISFARMDRASRLTSRVSVNKAYTAIEFRYDTADIHERLFKGEGKRDVAWFGDPRLAPILGGVLLTKEEDVKLKVPGITPGRIVGAVGTSGRTAEEDEELARVGANAYQRILKRRRGE